MPTRYVEALPPPTESTVEIVLYRQTRDGTQYVRWATCNGWDEARQEIHGEAYDASRDAGGTATPAGKAAYVAMVARFTAFEETVTTTRETLTLGVVANRVTLSGPS